ncbi:phosphotransferase family protein [Rhodococcoides fascians]|uniref:phosphotransferase family protein n=1 Tax=Rhodococcoides fascians TaxID=1828 RepID=UPI000565BD2C|nr:phosphotransferase family protein [Rhodococcus fascians]
MTPSAHRELIPTARLASALVGATDDPRWHEVRADLISGGKSNLTFVLSSPAGELVLRRPPTGDLLPSAHDMMREVRVQRALASSPVPCARVILADAGDLLGFAFYVMEKIPGHIIRDILPDDYAVSRSSKQDLAFAFIDNLAALHSVDPRAVGLADYGRPDGFMERQVHRWTERWEKSRTHSVPEMDELGTRLLARGAPVRQAATIMHGDYKMDNCVFDLEEPARINAILDWELSTLGDPLADLGWLLLFWREEGEADISSLAPGVTHIPGFPDRAKMVARYAATTGRDMSDLDHYRAFAHFKFAVIAQGVSARAAAGSMGGQSFGDLDHEIQACAEAGLNVVR